jgi:nucleotide-binding universal stress UspA family protein
MSIRKVLLPISADDDIDPLARMAFTIATMFSAKIEGVFIESTFPDRSAERNEPGKTKRPVEQARAERERKEARAQQVYDHWTSRFPKVETTLVIREGSPDAVYAQRARLSDISVIGSAHRYDSEYWRGIRDAVLFQSGSPVMVVPSRKGPAYGLEKVLIAWKEGLPASRAIKAAQPFMTNASEVHLIAVGEDQDSVASVQDVEEYLQLHYADAHTEVIGQSGRKAGDLLLSRAEGLGALLVMGAYTRSLAEERAYGSVTEFMLSEATVPVLMMH